MNSRQAAIIALMVVVAALFIWMIVIMDRGAGLTVVGILATVSFSGLAIAGYIIENWRR